MNPDEYTVHLMPFPGDIKAAVRVDVDGYPSIYINDYLSPQAKKKALEHELRHISRDDFYNDLSITEVESEG